MSVTIDDVRTCLNDMTTAEVSDDTITDKISDAEAWVDDSGGDVDDGDSGERAVKYFAAFLSYQVSNTYLSASSGPVSVREDIERKANHLLEMANRALGRAVDSPSIVTKKIKLIRKYTSDEQEENPDSFSLVV